MAGEMECTAVELELPGAWPYGEIRLSDIIIIK